MDKKLQAECAERARCVAEAEAESIRVELDNVLALIGVLEAVAWGIGERLGIEI